MKNQKNSRTLLCLLRNKNSFEIKKINIWLLKSKKKEAVSAEQKKFKMNYRDEDNANGETSSA